MCLEDLRMGRKKFTRITQKLVDTTADNLIVGQSKDRTHIRISTDETNATVAPSDHGTTATRGILLTPNKPDLEMSVEEYGNIVTGQWVGCSTLGTTVVTIVETFYKDNGE